MTSSGSCPTGTCYHRRTLRSAVWSNRARKRRKPSLSDLDVLSCLHHWRPTKIPSSGSLLPSIRVSFQCRLEPPSEDVRRWRIFCQQCYIYLATVLSCSPPSLTCKDVRTSLPARIQYDMQRDLWSADELQLRSHSQWIQGTQICQKPWKQHFTGSSPSPDHDDDYSVTLRC